MQIDHPSRARIIAVVVLAAIGALAGDQAAMGATPAANSGEPGSRCKAAAYTVTDPGADSALDTTSLGEAAPASYEIGMPTSLPERLQPLRRVMILVHGGSWYTVGRRAMRSQRSVAARWRSAGWATVSVSYRACGRSVADVLRFYDLVRARVGAAVPICLLGQSAGGHLALMVAAKRSDVACAMSEGGPTDLRRIASQGAAEALDGTGPSGLREGSRRIQHLARAAFGAERLHAQSPVTHAARIGARLLLGTAASDNLVPSGQAQTLAAAVRSAHGDAYVDVDRLSAGTTTWVHGSISAAAAAGYRARVARLVAPIGRPPRTGPFLPPPLPFFFRPRAGL